MTKNIPLRIDKFLWAVRIYKTRSLATQACNGGKVKIDGASIKPSHHINVGEVFTITQRYIIRTFKILALLGNRVSAKLISQYIEELTSQKEIDKLKIERLTSYVQRYRGTGRPTKKERRLIERFKI